MVDFSENYILAAQTEILSEYYFLDQVTIFVHIVYRHVVEEVDGVSSTPDHRVVIKETHFYISDDTQHDTHFVQYCFHKFFESLVQRAIQITRHWVWSDGCAGQFKSARSFYWLTRLHVSLNVQITWNFFESGHGKGEHDGAGACVKRALRRYQLQHDAIDLKCSTQVLELCNVYLSHLREKETSVRR